MSEVVSQDKARYCESGTQSVTVGRTRQAAAKITRGRALTERVSLELGKFTDQEPNEELVVR